MRLTLRNWLIRGLILAGVAALVGLGWVANSWVSPERVRDQVIASLNEQFDGVDIQIGSAHMRILGGIAVSDLKLSCRGSPSDQAFFVAPSAVLYHDKEQLNRGRLVIKKIELENPELTLERMGDGRWNLAGILRVGPADRPVPTFVTKGATLTIIDHGPDALPPLRLTDARLTILNDPLPVLTITAEAIAPGYGPVQVRARLNRVTRHAAIGLELPEFPLGELAPVITERFAPQLVRYLGKFTATAAVKADLTYTPDPVPSWRHDVRVEVKDGRLEHPDLPWPIEKIAVKLRSVDGRLKVEEATAKIGPAQVKIALQTRNQETEDRREKTGPSSRNAESAERSGVEAGDFLAGIEEQLQKLEVTASGIPLDEALFTRLGDMGARAKRRFAPVGAVEVGYKFNREAAGWRREIEVRPQSIGITCEKFKYPVS